jgi:hypothetical protein
VLAQGEVTAKQSAVVGQGRQQQLRNEASEVGLRAGSYTSASGFYRVTVMDNGMIVSRGWWGLGKENVFWASPAVGFSHLQSMLGRDRAMLAAGAIIMAWPGDDPKQGPQGTEWRGREGSQPGDGGGNYYNPDTGESYRPDFNHPDPVGPHWDYRDSGGNWYRIYPDGTTEPKP